MHCLSAPPLPQFSVHAVEFSSYLTRREQSQKNKSLVKASFPCEDFAASSLQGFPFLLCLPAGVQDMSKGPYPVHRYLSSLGLDETPCPPGLVVLPSQSGQY